MIVTVIVLESVVVIVVTVMVTETGDFPAFDCGSRSVCDKAISLPPIAIGKCVCYRAISLPSIAIEKCVCDPDCVAGNGYVRIYMNSRVGIVVMVILFL